MYPRTMVWKCLKPCLFVCLLETSFLCNLGCPGIWFVDQTGLKLKDLPPATTSCKALILITSLKPGLREDFLIGHLNRNDTQNTMTILITEGKHVAFVLSLLLSRDFSEMLLSTKKIKPGSRDSRPLST